MTVADLFTVIIALSLLMGGMVLAPLVKATNRAIFNGGAHDPLLVGVTTIPLVAMLLATAYLIVWGTWLYHAPIDLRQYRGGIGVWAWFMTMRFSGYLALIGMLLYQPINEFCLWLNAIGKQPFARCMDKNP